MKVEDVCNDSRQALQAVNLHFGRIPRKQFCGHVQLGDESQADTFTGE